MEPMTVDWLKYTHVPIQVFMLGGLVAVFLIAWLHDRRGYREERELLDGGWIAAARRRGWLKLDG